MDGMYDRVLLHVQCEQLIHRELEELPQHADRHREAERGDRQEQRRQVELHPVAAVEQIHQRESDRGGQKSVQRVQRDVPEREQHIERTDLAENLRAEDEQQHDDLQRGRQLHLERDLHERRNQEHHQGQ